MGAEDGDGIEMDTAGILHEMVRLRDNGETLSTAWSAARTAIDGNDAGIGADLLGSTFRRIYAPDHTRVQELANGVPPMMSASAQIGEQSAYFYRAADANGRNSMPRPPR
jgi:hypothetical protein